MHLIRTTILCTTCLLPFLSAFAQGRSEDRQYLSAVLAVSSRKEAAYYRVAEGVRDGYHMGRIYTMDGRLKAEGTYADEALTIEHGPFTFYHPNGSVESKGTYVMGYKSGVWERYDDVGRPLAERIYDPEPLTNIVHVRAQTMPRTAVGDDRQLAQYIKERVAPPGKGRIKGTVVLSFIVERNGELSAMHVAKGIGTSVDEQVLDALKTTSPWEPGLDRGQPVRVRMQVPVQF